MVSYSAWLHGVSCPQETVGKRFPVRLDSMVFHTDRKLFAYSFLFGLAPLHFISAGNYSRKVSCPTWHHSISYRQETFCEGFPIRLDSMLFLTPQETVRERFPVRLDSTVFLTHRKLFAKGFLFGLAPWCFLHTGNCSPIVSYSAWLHGVSYRQETVCEGFPIQLGSMVFLTHRKLFVGRFLDSARNDKRAWLHSVSYLQETFHSPSYPGKLSSCRGGSISLYLD